VVLILLFLLLLLVGSKSERAATESVAASSTPASSSVNVETSGSGVGSGTQAMDVQIDEHNVAPATRAPEVVVVDDQEDEEDKDQVHLTGKRKKKCTSDVWNYFTKKIEIVEVDGKQYEQLWGYCDFPKCKQRYRAEGNHGTTGFKNHLRSAHGIVKGQQQLNVGTEITHIQPYKYDQEASLKKLNLAIIMHEYPFNIVEHEYLVDFIKSLRPSFPIKSRVTIRKEIMENFLEEKDRLYAYLKSMQCRFSATMDMWTSCQNKGYMCVTIHWIDDDWRMQKRIVGFFNVKGRHTGAKLSESFTEVMVKWYIENRLFALTLDNASSNEVAVQDIISDLKENGNGSIVCDGIFFHVRCACHILNLVARDGLKVISATIGKVKSLVLAVKGSPLQWEELMKCATESGLDTKRGISLDITTRWNSTYLMLRDALYYKDAFMRLKSSNRRRYAKISPSNAEWDKALTIFQCLKKFYDLTEILSGTSYPTANLFYKGFCDIKLLLDDWSFSNDATISAMAISMSEKFEKYWQQSNIALAVACFLDPRYKKKLIEYYMRKFYGDQYQVELDEFVSVVKKLYQFYASSAPAPTKEKSKAAGPSSTADVLMENVDNDLEAFLYSQNQPGMIESNELEKYIAEPLLQIVGQFDILAWWKNKREEYPILTQIVRDVMAIQVSTVASESAFSAAGRVVDPYRNRLDPEIIEALICTKDWIAAARKGKDHIFGLAANSNVANKCISDFSMFHFVFRF